MRCVLEKLEADNSEIRLKERQADFLENIKMLDKKAYLETSFFYLSAPVISGVKPSVLITVRKEYHATWEMCGEVICKKIGLSAICLSRLQRDWQILIYDKHLLESYVNEENSSRLLLEHSYNIALSKKNRLSHMLVHLQERYKKLTEFPHEIGIFLGYPPNDVRSFIANKGEDCACCKYWKVYHDEERANEIFEKIDSVKRYALELLEKSVSIQRAVYELRTNLAA